MGSNYYYRCITCDQLDDGYHYDPSELVGLWSVRKELVALYNCNIPMRLHDGICYNEYARFFMAHMDHECEVTDGSWSQKLENEPQLEKVELINLRQLVSADGLRSQIVACEPGVPRTVNTVLAPKIRVYGGELGGASIPESRRYEYRKDVPAVIRIYEEKT